MKIKKSIYIIMLMVLAAFISVGTGYSLWIFYEQPEGKTIDETVKADDIKENYSFGEESDSANLKETDVTIYVFPSTVYYDLYIKGYLEYDSLYSKLTDSYSHNTYYYAENTPESYKCLPEDKFGYITPVLDDTGSIKDADEDGNPEFTVTYKKASDGKDQVYPSATKIHRDKGSKKDDNNLQISKTQQYYEIKTIDELAYPKFVGTTNYSHFGQWYEYTDEILRWANGEYYAGRFIKKHDTERYYYASLMSKLNPCGIDADYYNEIYKFYEKYYIDEASKWNEKNGDLTTSIFYRYDSDVTTAKECNNPWSSYYMGDPELDKTPKTVFVNSLQAYGRNYHYIDKFGYWSNLNYKEGRYLPIKLDTNTSMTADWFDSIVKNLNCDMLSDLSTTEGDQSELGAKAWAGYSFAGFTYLTENSDGTYNYPYSDMMDMYNSYVNQRVFDPFQNLLNYATYEDTDGDGVEDGYVVRLFPIYSMGKNLSTSCTEYDTAVNDDYPYYPEGYDSNTIGLYDSYRLKITYKDSDTSPVYDKQRYFYYTYSNDYITDDGDDDATDYESLYAGSTYCSLQNFRVQSNMATVEFQLACKTYEKNYNQTKWSMDGYASDWLTLMTATEDDLSLIFATYGDNIFINLYIFSDDIFGIKQYKGEDATNIDNINRLASESDTIFSSLTNKEISGINVKGDYTYSNSQSPSNTTQGVSIIDVSTSTSKTKSYSIRNRSFLFGLEYVRNIKLITGVDTTGISDDASAASELADSLKSSYRSARQYTRTRENMAVKYKDSYDSEEVTTHTMEDKYAYRYIIENVNLVDLKYGTLFSLAYPDPKSAVSQNVVFWPGSYMYARGDDDTYNVDENGRPKKYTSSLLYMYTDTGAYAREFVSADECFGSNKASMGDSGNLYWWQDSGSQNGLYDLILIKEPLKNVYYVFAYKHTNIFTKIFAEDVEVDKDGYAIHDENNIKDTNKMLFDRSYNIGDKMHREDQYLGRTLETILADYFSTKGIEDYSNYVLKDHVTGRIVATYEQDASSSSYALTFVDSFKIRKNYIFYLAENSTT